MPDTAELETLPADKSFGELVKELLGVHSELHKCAHTTNTILSVQIDRLTARVQHLEQRLDDYTDDGK